MIPKHCNPSPHTFLSLALGGLLLTGCGGGGGGSSVEPPAAPTLHLSVQAIKTFAFTWDAVDGATHYQLLENTDGSSGFSPIAGTDHLTVTTYDHVVPLHQRVNASYVLQACNSSGCTDSAPVAVTGNLAQAIGYFKASNTEAGDEFGTAIALSADGNTLAVWAPYEDSGSAGVDGNQSDNGAPNSGAVYVFVRNGGTWSQQAYLKASNTEANDQFGNALAISADGNTLAVGAWGEDSAATGIDGDASNNDAVFSGAVFIFSRDGDTWFQQAYVKAPNTGAGDQFGTSVALSGSGDTLAVGVPMEDGPTDTLTNSGAVYMYTRSAGVWSGHNVIRAPAANAEDRFGNSVALSGDGNTLAVGSRLEDGSAKGINGVQDENATNSGAVYVYARTAADWSLQAYVKASNTEENDWFGYSVALSGNGNTLAVAAMNEDGGSAGVDGDQDDNSLNDSGAVYIFQREGETWSQAAYLKASNPRADDYFGEGLALSADGLTVAVGIRYEGSGAVGLGGDQHDTSATSSGAAYVFTGAGGTWRQQAYVKAPNTQASDYFGVALAVSGDGGTLAVGATGEDGDTTGVGGDGGSNWAEDSGAVYLY